MVVLRVKDLVIPERNVAHGEVIEAGPVCSLEACDGDLGLRV